QNLIRRLRKPGSVILELKGVVDPAKAKIEAIDGVKEVGVIHERGDWVSFAITTDPLIDVREDLFALVQREKWSIRELASRAASLEDAFVDILQQTPDAAVPAVEAPNLDLEDSAAESDDDAENESNSLTAST
ncbi:MAG: hypothetical protein NWQ95_04700, partial [Verrucomicrobiales bacterium]|nr:hypothetical protein [Verrucomicrobiales bacterium]